MSTSRFSIWGAYFIQQSPQVPRPQGNAKEYCCYIKKFPDIFICPQNLDLYIYKHSMKMTDIGLTALIDDSTTKFEIWFRKRKPNDTFVLQSMSEEVKQAWTEEISKLLWKQALRNRGTKKVFYELG